MKRERNYQKEKKDRVRKVKTNSKVMMKVSSLLLMRRSDLITKINKRRGLLKSLALKIQILGISKENNFKVLKISKRKESTNMAMESKILNSSVRRLTIKTKGKQEENSVRITKMKIKILLGKVN